MQKQSWYGVGSWYTCHSGIPEAEAGRLQAQGQPDLNSKFQNGQDSSSKQGKGKKIREGRQSVNALS